jgi:hypothetical protein
MEESKKIELVFPETDISIENRPARRGPDGKMLQKFVTGIDEIATWFNKYEIQSMELWISGGIETEGILKLAVSAKGEGGLKVILKLKKDTQQTS